MTHKHFAFIVLSCVGSQLLGAAEASKAPYQKMIEISEKTRTQKILEKLRTIEKLVSEPKKHHWILERAADAYRDFLLWTFRALDYSKEELEQNTPTFEQILKEVHKEIAKK